MAQLLPYYYEEVFYPNTFMVKYKVGRQLKHWPVELGEIGNNS